ncbi:MAG: AMP-binding protein [Actinobacteria bacterium]|nr:AMP-binding protein [Actinomycetota bacterium]
MSFSPVSLRSVADLLREGVAAHPDRTLLVNEDRGGEVTSFTWREVLEHAGGVAARLAAAGAEAGDRIHLHLANRPEFLFAWFGAALAGYSIVPTNTGATPEEIAFITGHAETRISITEETYLATVEAVHGDAGVPVLCCERDDLLGATAADPGASIRPEDELGIIYTSGTTSRPKGAVVTNANYLFVGEVYAKAVALTPADRLLVALPLFHANAQYYSTMGALTARATIVLVPRFSASRYVLQCAAHGATVGSLFSAPIRMILAQDAAARTRDHQLRAVFFAQNLSDAELDQWEREVGAPLLQMYGMTETIGPPLMNPIWGRSKYDTVGRVTLGYTCRVVDEEGHDVEPGKRGELLVGGVPGVSLIAGYLHDEAATAAAMRDGWLHTGDVVAVDEDGYFAFVDRNKDMIKRAGENVAASEVEAVLLDHPDVAETAVVGVPDAMREEAIIAFVVPRGEGATEGELLEWCAARLAKFRVPSEVATVNELPRTPVGKIQKHLLRAGYLDSRG